MNIEWITANQIEVEVLSNLDLASMYFYLEDIGGFLGRNLDVMNVTEVKAAEHLDLSFSDPLEEIVEFSLLLEDIKYTSNSTIFCLRGGAGSGKTLLLTKLALHLQPNLDLISEKIKLPVLIRLRDCGNKGLEEYIFHKKQEYNINTQGNFQFIYLLDGLDELNDQKCIEVLYDIHSISQKEDTKCIVISSRESSSNLILLRNYFDNIKYLKINQIIYSDIENYFNKKEILKK
ncbi:MAG: NACHT domain-containing protein [Methanosarcina barkeri]|nr:NACHT domain-containing protein [Methanosarcina sp. ERenArc_MAG2]